MSEYPEPTSWMIQRVANYLFRGWPATEEDKFLARRIAMYALRQSYCGEVGRDARASAAMRYIRHSMFDANPQNDLHRARLGRSLIQRERGVMAA